VSPEERDEFLRGVRPAVVSTLGADGRVHAVLVWYSWDGSKFTVLGDRGSVKERNVRRTGRATIVVHEDINYVSAEGPVTVRETVTYEERLALWSRYYGEERARQVLPEEAPVRTVALELIPERWIEVPGGS
jgi:PPOX class probable F420-dependent enzyme